MSTDKITDMYESGMTQVEIAQKLGVTQAGISYHLLKRKVPIRKNTFSESAKKSAIENHVRGDRHPSYVNIPIEDIKAEYLRGASTSTIGAKYGVSAVTIGRKLKNAGVVLKSAGFGNWSKAKDGHNVQSFYELEVDNWLYDHFIEHVNQPSLPFGRNCRSDFLVGDTYIEVLGLISSVIYKDKYAKKLNLYKEHNLKVICVFPSHLRNGLKILEQLL